MPKIAMPIDNFIKEHKHLCNVLASGNKEARHKEAEKQAAELRRVMGHPGVKEHLMMKRRNGMKATEGDRLVHEHEYS